jgi:hypothetical protein
MNTIHRLGDRFIKGPQTLSFHDLQWEFTTAYPAGLYRKARRKLTLARIFNVTSLGVFIYSLFHINDVRNSVEYAVGLGVLGYTGSAFQASSNKYADQAIWERNRDALFGSEPAK